jgi:hypothetical protein
VRALHRALDRVGGGRPGPSTRIIGTARNVRVFARAEPTDLRAGYDGLVALAVSRLIPRCRGPLMARPVRLREQAGR